MNIKDNYIVPEEKRIKLGNYIKETRLNSSYRIIWYYCNIKFSNLKSWKWKNSKNKSLFITGHCKRVRDRL